MWTAKKENIPFTTTQCAAILRVILLPFWEYDIKSFSHPSFTSSITLPNVLFNYSDIDKEYVTDTILITSTRTGATIMGLQGGGIDAERSWFLR